MEGGKRRSETRELNDANKVPGVRGKEEKME